MFVVGDAKAARHGAYSVREVERAQRGSGWKGKVFAFSLQYGIYTMVGLQSTSEADDGREEGRPFSAQECFRSYKQCTR